MPTTAASPDTALPTRGPSVSVPNRPMLAGPLRLLHVPVLVYHHVLPADQVSPTERLPGLYLNPTLFQEQLAALQAAGWHTITSAELAAAVLSGAAIPPRTLVLTFDDGRPDNYTYAFPELQHYGDLATFFVVPGRIGTSASMTAQELQSLVSSGEDIGDHTWDHKDLTTLSYQGDLYEIGTAATAILDAVGVRPTTLAYPYGRVDSTVIKAADAEGMVLAFTTAAGADESFGSRLDEPRLRVAGYGRNPDGSLSGGTTPTALLAMLAPYSAW
jgi:peptidoglycan/xylan/chitin deacetylase (PgdA/CDA1 family)